MQQPVFRLSLAVALVIAITFGFVSGIIGELWINQFLAPDIQFRDYSDLTRRLDELTSQQRKELKDLLSEQDYSLNSIIEQVRPAVVSVYTMHETTTQLPQLVTDAQILGTGFVLTSDGWVVVMRDTVKDAKAKYAIRVNNKLYPITTQIADPATQVVFVKIDASNLPVVNLGSKDRLTPGLSVFVPTSQQQLIRTTISDAVSAPSATAADLIHSSEVYYRLVTLSSPVTKDMIGAPVFTFDGRMVGVVHDEQGSVMPVDYLTPVIKQAVKQDPITRSVLGVHFVDVEQVPNLNVTVTRGAYIMGDATRAAVIAKSPAAVAGIVPGDVIVKVDADEVNRFQTLSQLIQDYAPGSSVTLTVLRDGQEKQVTVTLGS